MTNISSENVWNRLLYAPRSPNSSTWTISWGHWFIFIPWKSNAFNYYQNLFFILYVILYVCVYICVYMCTYICVQKGKREIFIYSFLSSCGTHRACIEAIIHKRHINILQINTKEKTLPSDIHWCPWSKEILCEQGPLLDSVVTEILPTNQHKHMEVNCF